MSPTLVIAEGGVLTAVRLIADQCEIARPTNDITRGTPGRYELTTRLPDERRDPAARPAGKVRELGTPRPEGRVERPVHVVTRKGKLAGPPRVELPPATIFPSGWSTRSATESSLPFPKSVLTVPSSPNLSAGLLSTQEPPSSRLPSWLYRTRTKSPVLIIPVLDRIQYPVDPLLRPR